MNPGEWLDQKCRTLVVPDDSEEGKAVRVGLNAVEDCIEGIAERHPCGSFAKSTMLPGRQEADLVVVLADPPTDQTLNELRDVLSSELSQLARPPEVRFKAIEVAFSSGVKVDVLPVAKKGVTADGPSVPRKLRVALSGPEHVSWFTDNAHGTVIHPVVRALKYYRDLHPAAWGELSSFAIEVMAVNLLESHQDDGLFPCFRRVLDAVAGGWLKDRTLPDPARPSNDLLVDVDASARKQIADSARDAVAWADGEQWSWVFPSDRQPPRPSTNLGGKTLG